MALGSVLGPFSRTGSPPNQPFVYICKYESRQFFGMLRGGCFGGILGFLLDLVHRHRPHILLLAETKTHQNNVLPILQNFIYDSMILTSFRGVSGSSRILLRLRWTS